MIPKTIHYCWFGKGDKPQNVLNNIRNWERILPDYKIKEWNETNFDISGLPFTKEAYLAKRYAFVSDVARLYALINYGGIYLDTDVRLLKSFNSYLILHSFLGKELPFKVGTAVIGAEKGCDWLNKFYDTYKDKHFINLNGTLNDTENTALLTHYFNITYPDYKDYVKIFDVDVFCAKLFLRNSYCISNNTVAVHEYSASWINKRKTVKDRIKLLLLRLISK